MKSETEYPYHIPLPNNKKITLYKNGDNENIYYYFRYNKNSFRGSTGFSDLGSSITKSLKIYDDIKKYKRKTSTKRNQFDYLCNKYLLFKENIDNDTSRRPLNPNTLEVMKRQSRPLIEFFKKTNIQELCNSSSYSPYQNWRKRYYETHEKQKYFKKGNKIINSRKFDEVNDTTIDHEMKLFTSILRYCKNVLNILPDTQVPKYQRLDYKKKSGEKKGNKILTDNEFERLRDYMSKLYPYQWSMINFVNSTGLRYPSELLHLQWKDIDFEIPCVQIRDRKSPGNILTSYIPLVGTSFEILQKLKNRPNISTGENDFVFVNDKGKQIKDISYVFKKSLKECGISTSYKIYSFRHRYTTRMLKSGLSIVMLSRILGHSNTNTLMKHYEQIEIEHYVKVLEEMNEKYYQDKEQRGHEKK